MYRLIATIRKEMLLLIRDRSGLAIMFLMPVALVTIMALIQDGPFRDYQELKIPLLLINNDEGDLGKQIEEGLSGSKIFEVTRFQGSEAEARDRVRKGDYQIGIIIPGGSSRKLSLRVEQQVEETMRSMGISGTGEQNTDTAYAETTVPVFFAPDIKKSFRNSVISSIGHVSSKLETQHMITAFKKAVNENYEDSAQTEIRDFIRFSETEGNNDRFPQGMNSVQHNVPAWTLFGMFFIVISLAGSMIKERNDGSYVRIRTMPGTYGTVMAGKLITYLAVCLTQCLLMILTGIFLLPLLGLPQLETGSGFTALVAVSVCSGLAAVGFGVLTGTLFNTHQQSSTFGAVAVVILAALGGIWVPVFVMPEMVQLFATLSPLYWGLDAFQMVFLENAGLPDVGVPCLKLLIFCCFTLTIAYFVNKIKNN